MVGLPPRARHKQTMVEAHRGGIHSGGFDLKRQIEDFMTPYFRYIKTIYLAMTAWKVSALCTKAGASSQYEKQDSTLHRDYSETVLDHPPWERPMSIIMALNSFSFLVKPPLPSNEDENVETMVERGQAIVCTNDQLHVGGPNHEPRMVFVYLPTLSATRRTTQIPKYIPIYCSDRKQPPLHG